MAQRISEAQLREWMARLGPRLINLSTAICHDRHRAEEIVQEAFVKLWRRPPDAGEVAYPSWMRRVVTNLSINALKRTKRHRALPEHSNDPAMHERGRPLDRMDASEELNEVATAIDRLDEAKRTILVLRAYEGLSYEEISQHLDIPVGTVMSRLNRARAALKEKLDRAAEAKEHDEDENPVVYRFRQA